GEPEYSIIFSRRGAAIPSESLLTMVHDELRRRHSGAYDHLTQAPMIWTAVRNAGSAALSEVGFDPQLIRRGNIDLG
ncbi:hypothetical protein FOZ62_005423, partial [Perkinsus olseni]